MTPPLIVPSITSALTIVELLVYGCFPRVTDVMRKSTALMCRLHMRMQLQQLWYMVHTGAGGASACADLQIRAVSWVPPRDLTHLRGGRPVLTWGRLHPWVRPGSPVRPHSIRCTSPSTHRSAVRIAGVASGMFWLGCGREVDRADVSWTGVAEAFRAHLLGEHTGQLVCAVTPAATDR